MAEEIATLAGGCFWCVEAVVKDLIGVSAVESGYIGGQTVNPTYQQVCSGDTGHAEAIRVTFDPALIGYGDLLVDGIFRYRRENPLGEGAGMQYPPVGEAADVNDLEGVLRSGDIGGNDAGPDGFRPVFEEGQGAAAGSARHRIG